MSAISPSFPVPRALTALLCRVLAALAAVLVSAPPVQAQDVQKAWEGTVSARTLNVRAGPGEGYEVVAQLERGDAVTAVDRQDGWIRLTGLDAPDGDPPGEGWVAESFLRLPDDFMAPAFGDEGNAFLDWAAERGDLLQVAIDTDTRLSLVLSPNVAEARAGPIAREIGCAYRERLAIAETVTVTVWPEEGPAAGWIAQAVCP